jgi:hypothetical protein
MKSTQSLSWIKIVALVFMAVCAGTSLASAQEYNGKFSLPVEARWGAAVLPPGEYTLTLDNNRSLNGMVVVRGATQQAVVMPLFVEHRTMAGQSALITVHSGDDYKIQGLYIAELGMFLDYGVAGGKKQLIAQTPVLIRRLPVAAAGK